MYKPQKIRRGPPLRKALALRALQQDGTIEAMCGLAAAMVYGVPGTRKLDPTEKLVNDILAKR